jgi:hypothetical protein
MFAIIYVDWCSKITAYIVILLACLKGGCEHVELLFRMCVTLEADFSLHCKEVKNQRLILNMYSHVVMFFH